MVVSSGLTAEVLCSCGRLHVYVSVKQGAKLVLISRVRVGHLVTTAASDQYLTLVMTYATP